MCLLKEVDSAHSPLEELTVLYEFAMFSNILLDKEQMSEIMKLFSSQSKRSTIIQLSGPRRKLTLTPEATRSENNATYHLESPECPPLLMGIF